KEVVEVVRSLGRRGNLGVDLLDGVLIQRAYRGQVGGEAAPEADRVGTPILCLLIVQKCVWPGGNDLVCQDRWLSGIAAMDPDLAGLEGLQQCSDTVDVEGFVQCVVNSLAHQYVVGNLDRTDDVVLASRRLGEDGCEEVVGLHALD